MIEPGLSINFPSLSTPDQITALQAELTDDEKDIADLQVNVQAALNETFVSRPDVFTPGPPIPQAGNVYVTVPNVGIVLCPRALFLKTDGTFETWLANNAPDTAPLAISRHSVPQGTINVAYASTTFTADHGCPFPLTWSVSANGDALPNGMSLNGTTGVLSGTPTVAGTFNIIIHVVDALGAIDEETYQLVIAPVQAFAFSLPPFSNFQVGQSVSHDCKNDATNAAGALSFSSYNTSAVSGVSSSTAFNSFTKSGLTVANDRVVAFSGLSATTGVSNGPAQTYFVVNSTPGTGFQVALTKGGSPVDLTGSDQSGTITVNFPTLPVHKLQLDPTTGLLTTSAPFAATDVGTWKFYVTAFDGTTTIAAQGSITVVAAGGPTITTTTVPSGTKNSAYTPTTFNATDNDTNSSPFTWSVYDKTVDPVNGGDSLPTGMTFTGNVDNTATLAGTPTTFGTSNLIIKVVDNNGNSDTQAITLVVADVSAPFAFGLPNPLPNATPGTDYSHNCAQDCTHAAGTLSFDSYNSTPITSVTMNDAGDTFTWSGQAASIPNGTTIALEGITGSPGVSNGPSTTYFVVSSGTRTIQLSPTSGGSPIAVSGGNQTGLTIQFPTLPAKHFSLDPTTGIISATGAQITNAITFTIRAFDGTTRISKSSAIGITTGGATIDIATIGLVTGNLSGLTRNQQIAAATANANKINTAAETMRTHSGGQGSLSSSYPRGTVINLYNATANATLIHSGGSGTAGLNQWHLNGAELRALDGQPLGAEGTSGRVFFLQRATAPELDFTINGNGANQAQVDLTRTTGAKMGYAAHPCALWYCGPIKFGQWVGGVCVQPFISKNGRAVTGATADGINIDGHGHFPAVECFDVESHRNVGGNTGWIQIFTDDGSYKDTSVTSGGKPLITACSGFKSHFQTGDNSGYHMDQLLIQVGQKGVPGSGRRHGIGGFAAGRVQALAGSFAVYCHHGANIEEGTDSPNYDITEIFNLGDGSSYTSFETQNCDYGITIDGYSTGCKTVTISGWTSTNDGTAILETRAPNRDGVYLNMVRINGANAATNFPASCAAKTHLTDCKTRSVGRVNAGTAAAFGSWGTY